MTTTVIITSPKPNHKAVEVTVQYPGLSGHDTGKGYTVVLTDGESVERYVHDGAQLLIREVEKPVPAEG